MTRRRRATSAETKRVAGTFRAGRSHMGVKVAALTRVPQPPETLHESCHAAWRRLAATAIATGSLASPDLPLLELTARTWVECEQLEKRLREEGHILNSRGALKSHPAAAALAKARSALHKLLVEFGLSARARSTLDIPQPEPKKSAKDAAEEKRINAYFGD